MLYVPRKAFLGASAALLGCTLLGRETRAQEAPPTPAPSPATLSLRVTDKGSDEPLTGVQVKLLRGDQVVLQRITGSDGGLREAAPAGRFTLAYRLDGYIRDPEYTLIELPAPHRDLTLVARNREPTYYQHVADKIGADVTALPEAERRVEFTDAWGELGSLPDEARRVILERWQQTVEAHYLASLPPSNY